MVLQQWKLQLKWHYNIGKILEQTKKTQIATVENGYHGDTFGAMSVGYVPEFFGKFKKQLFSTIQFPVPNKYRIPKGFTFLDYQNDCLEKIERRFSKNDDIAAFIMESGAQMAGGVIIYPKDFQKKISKLCKKYNILFVLDEIATGFGRLGSMTTIPRTKKYSRYSSIWKNVNRRISNNGSYTCK